MANLFARDEMDEILGELIPVMKKEFPRRPPTNENLNEYFMSRARQNLHMVLCFSPVGQSYLYQLTGVRLKLPYFIINQANKIWARSYLILIFLPKF